MHTGFSIRFAEEPMPSWLPHTSVAAIARKGSRLLSPLVPCRAVTNGHPGVCLPIRGVAGPFQPRSQDDRAHQPGCALERLQLPRCSTSGRKGAQRTAGQCVNKRTVALNGVAQGVGRHSMKQKSPVPFPVRAHALLACLSFQSGRL